MKKDLLEKIEFNRSDLGNIEAVKGYNIALSLIYHLTTDASLKSALAAYFEKNPESKVEAELVLDPRRIETYL